MKKALVIISLFFLFWGSTFAQKKDNLSTLTIEDAFQFKMPTQMDTIYYPFYNGVQMIEVDQIGFWDKKIFFLEQSDPRAMPHSMFHPMPIGNEYFFRDTTGTIVKAFNTKHSLSTLTKHFEKTPLNRKSPGVFASFPYHSSQDYRSGVWYQSPQPSLNFLGYYKVSTGYVEQETKDFLGSNTEETKTLKFGLIDSLGNIVIPIQYDEIQPFYKNLLVHKNNKCGIINYKHIALVPLVYDSYTIDYDDFPLNPKKSRNVFFLTFKKRKNYRPKPIYNTVFLTEENKLIPLNNYNEIHLERSRYFHPDTKKRFIFVVKNGKKGFLNAQYQEIIPPQHDILEYTKRNQGLYRVAKNSKFGFWDKNFKEIVPLEYDYAEYFKEDSTVLVLKNSRFYCLDNQGGKQSICNLKPRWEMGHLGFVADKNYISVKIGDVSGIIDTLSNSIILPIKYKSFTPIEVNAFFKRKKSLFKEKKIEYSHTPNMYDEILFHNNKIIVKNPNNQYGVLDTSFSVLIDFKYEKLEVIQCHLNYLIYSQNGKPGIIDFSGKNILSIAYDEIRYNTHYEQERDVFQVKIKEKWGIVNFENKVLLPCAYDSIRFLGHWNRPKIKLWVVEKNEKFGVVNDKNELFIPFEYHGISHLEGQNLWVERKNKKRYKVILQK